MVTLGSGIGTKTSEMTVDLMMPHSNTCVYTLCMIINILTDMYNTYVHTKFLITYVVSSLHYTSIHISILKMVLVVVTI